MITGINRVNNPLARTPSSEATSNVVSRSAVPKDIYVPSASPSSGVARAAGGSGSRFSPSDLHQGTIGDCTVIAGIDAVLLNDPSAISSDVTQTGSNTFVVRLCDLNRSWHSYSINTNNLPAGHATGSAEGEALEAAIIQANGGVAAVNQNDVYPSLVLQELTGRDVVEGSSTGEFEDALESVQEGGAAVVGTDTTQQNGWYNAQTGSYDGTHQKAGDVYLYSNHEYAIDNVGSQSVGSRTVTLNNPWENTQQGGGQFTLSEQALETIFGNGWGVSYIITGGSSGTSGS